VTPEIITSPGPASAVMRVTTCTATPRTLSLRRSTSPVWIPIRSSMPSACETRRIAAAQCTARSAPSNSANSPSPDRTVTEAAARMEEHHVHRLVVIEPDSSNPIGILSTTDLVRSIAGR